MSTECTVPVGCDAIKVGVDYVAAILDEVNRLCCEKVFILCSTSVLPAALKLESSLAEHHRLACDTCSQVKMGGAELGVLKACDVARAACADCVVSIGGGAVQDAGKLVGLWLSSGHTDKPVSMEMLEQVQKKVTLSNAVPHIACPVMFSMAEFTQRAGVNTTDNVKIVLAHASMVPNMIIFDPVLARFVPDWLCFGTALRAVDHGIESVCSQYASEETRSLALAGLQLVYRGIIDMATERTDAALIKIFVGGSHTIAALDKCGYLVGHFLENQYSAYFDIHRGACSAVLMARVLAFHADVTSSRQLQIVETLGASTSTTAASLIRDLVAALPSMPRDHTDAGINVNMLPRFAQFVFDRFAEDINRFSPKPFSNVDDILDVLMFPLDAL